MTAVRPPEPPDPAWARVEAVFLQALEVPSSERARLLDEACGEDEELRREVESLITEHESDPGFLETPPPWLTDEPDPIEREDRPTGTDSGTTADPERVGPYRILERLGRGGMGTVYLAERRAEEFEQTVALKVVRRGLDTDDVLRRFRAERRILSRLTHPNIARLLDVGTTEEGRPYLVIEHVEGQPLVEWCNDRDADVDTRIQLVEAVCSAVDHAHRHLVVHRDIKPNNILVTADGTPKLLDFGIAKVLAGGETEADLTRVGQRVLTPEYAAPEQLRGEDATTAVDVYALGVLLYELLTGRHPLQAALQRPRGEWSRAEIERAVLGGPPPRPGRPFDAGPPPGREIPHDLDSIIMTALRIEPEARYASPGALADDLRRFRTGYPVEARPASIAYRVGRFARRNPLLAGVSTAAALGLVTASAIIAIQSGRVQEEAARAVRERDKALEVRSFLLEAYGATGPEQAAGESVAAQTLLDNQAADVDQAYADDPEMLAEMKTVLAEAYERLGLIDQAAPLASDALDARRGLHGAGHPDVAAAEALLGWIEHRAGRPQEAETHLSSAIGFWEREGDDADPTRFARALNDLGVVREAAGDYERAEALYRRSLEVRDRSDDDQGSAVTSSNLAVILYRRGELEAAVDAAENALERFRSAFGPDHQRTTIVQSNLAAMKSAVGDHTGAAEAHREILQRRRRTLGDEHPQVAFSMTMLANELVAQDRAEEAEPLAERALEIQEALRGPRHPDVASALRVLATTRIEAGRPDEALPDLRRTLDLVRETRGSRHQEVAGVLTLIGRAHQLAGRSDEAAGHYADAHDLYLELVGPHTRLTADVAISLAQTWLAAGDTVGVRALADEVEGAVQALELGADHSFNDWVQWMREQVR